MNLTKAEMFCPKCGHNSTGVIDTRGSKIYPGERIRRRRMCNSCGYRFTTFEISADDYNSYMEMKNKSEEIAVNLKYISDFFDHKA